MSEEQVEEEKSVEIPLSLKDFIDDYQKTIAVIGVLIVLGLFWKNIYSDGSTPYVSYLCFLSTLPLLYEIIRAYDFNKASWNLRIFISLFSGVFLFSSAHLLTSYPNHLATITANVIWAGTILLLGYLVDKLSKYLKNHAYLEAIIYSEKIHNQEDLPLKTRNEIVTIKNGMLQSFYKLMNRLEMVALILIVIFSFIVLNYTNEFLQGLALPSDTPVNIPPPSTN